MSSYNSAYADIFDMSPASPSLAEGAHLHRHHGQDGQFMYHFPTYSAAKASPRSRPLLHPQQKQGRSSTSPPNAAHGHATARGQPSPQTSQKRSHSSFHLAASGTASKQLTPVSIVGFAPLKPSPSSPPQPTATSSRKKVNRVRLSPPPASFSYSANPWILPGRGDIIEGESDEVDRDDEYADYEFDKHLMGRINGRRTVQRYGKPTHTGVNHD